MTTTAEAAAAAAVAAAAAAAGALSHGHDPAARDAAMPKIMQTAHKTLPQDGKRVVVT